MALRRASTAVCSLLLKPSLRSQVDLSHFYYASPSCLHVLAWQDPNDDNQRSRGSPHVHSQALALILAQRQQSLVHFTSRRYAQHEPLKKEKSTVASDLPDAEDCDEILADYNSLKTKYQRLRYPPNYRSPMRRVQDFGVLVYNGAAATVGFVIGTPGYLLSLARMSRAEWSHAFQHTWKHVKEGAHHYWVGTKLLAYDTKIAFRLTLRTLSGQHLSRRERQQLTRTSADLFRLVPFVIIVVVPFLEFALPVLLRLFPNMLPSTYEDKLAKEEQLKRRLMVKIELARFLQETVEEMAKDIKRTRTGEVQDAADDLLRFIGKVRAGEQVENHEILRFAQLFNDELTLDNLERVQLSSICQFVGITPFGTDAFLRRRLREHLAKIKQDDADIMAEGLESLTTDELRQACRDRGLRAPYGEGSVPFMRNQLRDWLDLSLNRGLPSSLLLLSRAFTITANVKEPSAKRLKQFESLKETLGTLPEQVLDDVRFESGSQAGTSAMQLKLEVLKREEELIKQEAAERKLVLGDDVARQAAASAAAAAVVKEAAAGALAEHITNNDGISKEERAAEIAAAKQAKMKEVISALAVLASGSGVATERALFMDLVKKEINTLNSGVASKGSPMMSFTSKGLEVKRPDMNAGDDTEAGAPKQLSDRVSKILARIEKELDHAEDAIGSKLRIIDLDNDGLISRSELETAIGFLHEQLGEEELKLLLERLQLTSDNQKVQVEELYSLAGIKDKGPQQETVAIHTK